MIPILTKATQLVDKKVDSVDQEVRDLKTENTSVDQEVKDLKAENTALKEWACSQQNKPTFCK
jgi:FtsZ-binding cell division protein ZapB